MRSNRNISYPDFGSPRRYTQQQILTALAIIGIIALFYLYQQTSSLSYAVAILLGRIVGLVLGFTLHEWGHASTAMRLGDYTAYRQGRVTFDPRSHIEPYGLALALLTGFGWARPVPVNAHAFYPNERRGLLITALAGPVMNLGIALFFGVLFRIAVLAIPLFEHDLSLFLYRIVLTVILFNVTMFFFNLLPFHPLDGWKILLGMVDNEMSMQLARYEMLSYQILLTLLVIGFVFAPFDIIGNILSPMINLVYQLFTGL